MYRIQSFIGILIALFSLFFTIAGIGDILRPEESDTPIGVVWGLTFFFLLTSVGGIYLFIKGILRSRRYQHEKRERLILKLIAQNKGSITPEEIAANSSITISEARIFLDTLCQNGAGEIRVTEEGRILYHFFGFMSSQEKETAKNALDI